MNKLLPIPILLLIPYLLSGSNFNSPDMQSGLPNLNESVSSITRTLSKGLQIPPAEGVTVSLNPKDYINPNKILGDTSDEILENYYDDCSEDIQNPKSNCYLKIV